MRRSTIAILLCAGVAASAAPPSASELRGDAEGRGVMRSAPAAAPRGGLSPDGACYGGGRARVIRLDEAVAPATAFDTDTLYVCPGLGTYTVRRDDARLFRPTSAWFGPVPTDLLAGRSGLSRRLVADLAARGAAFPAVGTDEPATGPHGERVPALDEGGVLVALAVGPAGGADFLDDVAWVHPTAGLYWAHRSGGFAGVSLWLGPYPVPLARDAAPTAVVPASLPVRDRARRWKVSIRRPLAEGDTARVRRRDYAPADFDLGAGVEVLRVLRANARRIRVRVRVRPDASRGAHDVAVNGATGTALLELR